MDILTPSATANAATRKEAKMKTLYEIRWFPTPTAYSKPVGRKLKDYRHACRIVRFLKSRGVEAFKAPIRVRVS